MSSIKDYFLIGDMHTTALVSNTGSIDWLCLPHMDSPSVFAAILDEERGGKFSIELQKGYTSNTEYIPETAIVETTCAGKTSSFIVRDFLLPQASVDVIPHFLVRKVVGTRGESTVKFSFQPRVQYARQRVRIRKKSSHIFYARLGERNLWLHLPEDAKVRRKADGTSMDISFMVKEGESKSIIVEHSFETRLRFQKRDLEQETRDFWRQWVMKGTFFDFCRAELIRSAITLKLMQFYPTGAIIAAPTTSLPEDIGGVRNWDYRYVWLRDATFTLYALFVLGYSDEAKKFFHFIEEISEGFRECEDENCSVDIAIMYTVWGERVQREFTLPHLRGYQKSKPVRIGNGAAGQWLDGNTPRPCRVCPAYR